MSARGPIGTGKCGICGRSVRKSEMKKHLDTCIEEERKALKAGSAELTGIFRILVTGEDERGRDYWLNLEASEKATLSDLDALLRKVWLECCNHESRFAINRTFYTYSPKANFIHESLDFKLGDVLKEGVKFEYKYGPVYGIESTDLLLKVISRRVELVDPEKPIRIVARNEPPRRMCRCGQEAVVVCKSCNILNEGWLCDDCARFHDCGREEQLPVVNSPRVGMCNYLGDEEEAARYGEYQRMIVQREKKRLNEFLESHGKEPLFKDIEADEQDMDLADED